MDGRPITEVGDWRESKAVDIVRHVCAIGIERFIVLDLAAVGAGRGVESVSGLCRDLSAEFSAVQWISGGGVRDVHDLRRLAESGCHAALVASALHDGRLTLEQLKGQTAFAGD